VLGASSGCASKLAEVIISDVKAGCEACFVVHPCGDLAMDTLGSACSAAGLPYYPVVVYTSVYEDGDVWRLLSEETRQCATGKSDRTVTVFAFFSPGGVKTVMDHSPSLRECLVSPVSSCLCASIGPTTAKSLQASGVSDSSIVVSQTPTPDGLACAICDVLKRTIV
jgi:uroporphyrinogen-III synthase